MNRFKRKLRQWLYDCENSCVSVSGSDPIEHYEHYDHNINFSLIPARGGFVLSVRRYYHHQDESKRELYLINQEDNVGERIARIINLEMIK